MRITIVFIKTRWKRSVAAFEDKVTIKYAMSIHSYQPSLLHADLIISTVETPFPQPSIIIHPLFNLKRI